MFKLFGMAGCSKESRRIIEKSVERICTFEEGAHYFCELHKILKNNQRVMDLLKDIGEHDEYTRAHSISVGSFCAIIAFGVGMHAQEASEVVLAGLLHDVGKMDVSRKILNKPAKLSQAEFSEILKHPVSGYEILIREGFSEAVADGALSHHERIDYSGYPHSRGGSDIGVAARIVAVSDVFDAMISDRAYQKGINPLAVYRIISNEMRDSLDLKYLDVLINHLIVYEIGAAVNVDGCRGVIVGYSEVKKMFPVVKFAEGAWEGDSLDLSVMDVEIL